MPARYIAAAGRVRGIPKDNQVVKIVSGTVLSILLLAPASAGSYAKDGMPSFNCDKAATTTEKSICERWMGTALADRMLADLVKEAASVPGADIAKIKTDQKAFLKTRDACGAESECITDAYLTRIAELAPPERFAGRFSYDGTDERGGLVIIEGKGGRAGIWLITNNGQFSCGFDTLDAKRRGPAIVIETPASDEADACTATFAIEPGGQKVELTSACSSACGMNGYMDGGYTRIK